MTKTTRSINLRSLSPQPAPAKRGRKTARAEFGQPLLVIALLGLTLAFTGCRTTKEAPEPTSPVPFVETTPVPVPTTPITPAPTITTNVVETPAPPAPTEPEPTNNVQGPAIPPLSARTGDEIVIAGQLFHTGTRVVLWNETNGYNAYDLKKHFTSTPDPATEKAPAPSPLRKRYDRREGDLPPDELKRIRTNGWDLATLQRCIDQFVIHYDVAGTTRQCFYILHDRRFLSVHFMLDLDGTIYQTLDAQERARHASAANNRSVGIEIANVGAYPTNDTTLAQWYEHDTNGQPFVTLPARFGDGGLLTTNFIAHPARMEAITNSIHGRLLVQYDFTPQQYAALAHLTAALCRALPLIKCDAPRDANGKVLQAKVPDAELENYQGLVGHYHLTTSKTDPGPAFDWEKLLGEAKGLLDGETNSPPKQSW